MENDLFLQKRWLISVIFKLVDILVYWIKMQNIFSLIDLHKWATKHESHVSLPVSVLNIVQQSFNNTDEIRLLIF